MDLKHWKFKQRRKLAFAEARAETTGILGY